MKLIIDMPEEIMEYIKNNGCLSVVYNDEVAKAIINGIPYEPKGDLISREALKKAVINNFDNLQAYFLKDFIEEIDNAPTVFDCRSCKNNGNERECVDCHDYSNYVHYTERPQGKWHHSGECSVCHKRSYKTTPLGDIIGLDFTDFCKNCGADMRKGGAE